MAPKKSPSSSGFGEQSLFKAMLDKIGEVAVGLNKNTDGLQATDKRVDGIAAEVEALKERPSVTPAEISSLLGDLEKIKIK